MKVTNYTVRLADLLGAIDLEYEKARATLRDCPREAVEDTLDALVRQLGYKTVHEPGSRYYAPLCAKNKNRAAQ